MHALIFDTDPTAMVRQAAILMDKGFNVSCAESAATARAFLSSDTVDLLIAGASGPGMADKLRAMLPAMGGGQVAVLVMGEASGPDFADLSARLPGFYGMVGRAAGPDLLAQLAVSAVAGVDMEQAHRRRQRFVAAATAVMANRTTRSVASPPPAVAAPVLPAAPAPAPFLEDWTPAHPADPAVTGPLSPPNRDPMPDRRLHLS
ncbi:hypothetical protein EU803_03305 [Loktanella sp. IMCC34160]|uniref:hypothetical protein n=1 Tax=Loktanella sp. IMCC34160 TaxID=2510646 RepID=UPI00101D51C1|nr:hypothetical protein [Loktanella sp. IMCC34160]RYG93146.1 hypothetical protein EU803_03305 [Loktanella sp. IMCC34160]